MIPTLQLGQTGRRIKGAAGGGGGAGYRSRLQFGGADASTTFTDDTGKVWTPSGNAQIDTSLGDQRGLFDGASDYIKTPNHADLVFGTAAFKLAFTMRFNSKSGFQTICSKGYTGLSASLGWLLQTGNGDGRLNLYRCNTGSGAILICGESSGTINNGQDYAIEIERIGNDFYIRRDTVQVATVNDANNFTSTDEFSIGGGSGTGFNNFWFNGWIKDFRVT